MKRQNFPSAADKMRLVAAEIQERAEALAAEAAGMAATAAQLRGYADNLDSHGDIMPRNYSSLAASAAEGGAVTDSSLVVIKTEPGPGETTEGHPGRASMEGER